MEPQHQKRRERDVGSQPVHCGSTATFLWRRLHWIGNDLLHLFGPVQIKLLHLLVAVLLPLPDIVGFVAGCNPRYI